MGNHGSNLEEILAEDMHHWYNMFMRESPSGLITLFELKAILNLKGMSEDASSYVDQVFFTFDMDGVGSLVLFSIKVILVQLVGQISLLHFMNGFTPGCALLCCSSMSLCASGVS